MKKGIAIVYVLIFLTIFLLLFSGLLSFVLEEFKIVQKRISWEQAFEIAEAGIEYYKWCLNNELFEKCELEKEYKDKEGNPIGKFQLQVKTNFTCGTPIFYEVISTGWTYKFPSIQRRILGLFGQESVAKYAYILNSNVWVGADHQIRGPFHSNGGIRFDGKNFSLVSSSQEKWECTSSFGCGPNGVGYGIGLCPPECEIINKKCICPGIFSTTNNSNKSLFLFPSLQFDFAGITLDLSQIKNVAKTSGIYLPPTTQITSQGKGWHLIFNSNGTMEAKIITNLSPTWAYSLEEDWHYDYFTIVSEFTFNTYSIPPDCGVIFVEDNLWPEGKIKGKITLASANLIQANLETNVILNKNLEKEDSIENGLTLISEGSILIGPDSPEDMILEGIFIAQKGKFGRNHYPGNIKNSLTIQGSIISNNRIYTQWVNIGGKVVSGYKMRETFIDQNLIYRPPLFTPVLTSKSKVFQWQEL